MKNVMLLIIVVLGLVGCGSTVRVATDDRTQTIAASIVTIDDCEYFLCRNGYGDVLCHKGNCKNPIHRYRSVK